METQENTVEPVTISDILELATWNRQRTNEELRAFVTRRQTALLDNTEIE